MSIAQHLQETRNSLPEGVALVAVSKTQTEADILEAYRAGQRVFGENKVQELVAKAEALPKDIQWHMIGHLQRNKVKYLVGVTHLIHGVDSEKLLQEIDKRAAQAGIVMDCLLQVHIAEEATKVGFDADELSALVESDRLPGLKHVRIRGLMGMATFTDNQEQVRREFRVLKTLFDRVHALLPGADILSMGMSGDYLLAIAEGSTMVRIGSRIFGSRNYG